MAADYNHHHSPPSDHFFKFIPPGFKFNLSLPKSFSRNLKYNGRLKKATLRRGGREWLVAVSDDGVFGDGWRKLVIENGVQDFDFIVFKHQGDMVFDFLVFDQSMCERLRYPNSYDEMDVEETLTESDSTYNTDKMLTKRKKNDYLSTEEDKSQADDDHFVITMTPYTIKSSRLHVPLKFARSHGLTNRIRTQIAIVDEAQKTWSAMLNIRSSSEARLTCWAELKVNNHLEAGDVCMFKLVKHGKVPVFNFYKVRKKPIKNLIQVKKESILKATRSTQNDRSYFIATIKSYFKKSGLYLPSEFSRSNSLKAGEMVIRDYKGRSWKVEVQKSGEKCLYVGGGGGFKSFCKENGLREGDAFKLELVENNKDKPPIANFSLIVDATPSILKK